MIGLVFVFCLGFVYPLLFELGKLVFSTILVLIVYDLIVLYRVPKPITVTRVMEDRLSNGDENPVMLKIRSFMNFRVNLEVIDEFPAQLQIRDQSFKLQNCEPKFEDELMYEIRPVERGEYYFGDIVVLIHRPFGLMRRMVTVEASTMAKVYPSFIQFRKYSFLAISNRLEEVGVKKIRKLGSNNEFEQIRDYVRGDDFRRINWRATARRNSLMVNQYQEESAQNVYALIDKGRLMHMPFEGLTLMDYSINAALVLLGIAVGRGDKSGLITFSDKIGSFVPALDKTNQMNTISEALYNQKIRQKESDYLRLLKNVKMRIKKRSLLILFTNFDSMVSLHRQLKYLKSLSKSHLLCTVIFDNSEINKMANSRANTLDDIYDQTIAEKFQLDKKLIVRELSNHGIYTILTEPQGLTVNTINKYLEFKARGAI